MTAELVKRLRQWSGNNSFTSSHDALMTKNVCREAADALERLEENKLNIKEQVDRLNEHHLDCIQKYEAEIAMLREPHGCAWANAEIERLEDENANLRALLPFHEYNGQDR